MVMTIETTKTHATRARIAALLCLLVAMGGCGDDESAVADAGEETDGGLSGGDADVPDADGDASGEDADVGDGEAADGGDDEDAGADADAGGGDTEEGAFGASRVEGLSYSTESQSGTTDEDGRFTYREGETVTFRVGDLVLGETEAKAEVTALDLVADAEDATDARVNNILVLLHTLDANGDLNDGIQISEDIAAVVGGEELDLDQEPAAFAEDEAWLAALGKLDEEGAFAADTDPRPRAVRDAADARAYFARATAARKEVETEYGSVRGYAANEDTWQWLGVPYAKPPLGELRWKPTEAPEPWTRTRDAVAWSDQAAQDFALEATGEGGMSEDSLYLNVTAPDGAEGMPVMVWFHGGSFSILTGNSRAYNNPDGLTNQGVVLVVVNHRLGPFGYLAHPWLAEEASYGGSGNYGQMDLVMALTWVKNNIAQFGGDPGNVTIFGQSGGCGKTTSLILSPMAEGLFHKAICQSGNTPADPTATVESTIAGAEAVGTAMFERLEVASLEEARALPWTAIVQSDVDADIPRQVYRPTIDHHYMSKTYHQAFTDGIPNETPVMLGVTQGDYTSLVQAFKTVMPQRAGFATLPLYPYIVSAVPTGWVERDILCGHSGELPFLFNYPAMFANNYAFNLTQDATGMKPPIEDLNGNGVTGTDGDALDVIASLTWGDGDRAVADSLMTVWTQFAREGDPSTDALEWTPYTVDNDAYVEFGNAGAEFKEGLSVALDDAELPEVQAP